MSVQSDQRGAHSAPSEPAVQLYTACVVCEQLNIPIVDDMAAEVCVACEDAS